MPPSQTVLATDVRIGSRVITDLVKSPRVVIDTGVLDNGMIKIKGIGWTLYRHPSDTVTVLKESESSPA